MTLAEESKRLTESLVGRRIVRAVWHEATSEWPQGEEHAWLWLDDGRVIEFNGYGFDAYGATIDEIRLVDVAACLHCGKPHPDQMLFGPEEEGRCWAYCTDSNHHAIYLPADAPPPPAVDGGVG